MQIRPAEPADVPEILAMIRELAAYERAPDAVLATEADLHRALFTGEATGHAGGPSAYAHVAVLDASEGGPSLVGFALWFLNFSTWLGRHGLYLEDLYVREAHRGRGYGEALLRHLAGLCVERGYGRFEWWVLDWNSPAIEFYTARGAVPMDEWTVFRVTGEALDRLGAPTPPSAARR